MSQISQTQAETSEAQMGKVMMTNFKAYVGLLISQQTALSKTDVEDLKVRIKAITDVTDGDPDTEGFQIFKKLVADVNGLKTDNTSNKTRLTAIEKLASDLETNFSQRLDDLETNLKEGIAAQAKRVDELEKAGIDAATARLKKDNEHDTAIAGLDKTATNLESAVTAEAKRAAAKEGQLSDDIAVERKRTDVLEQNAKNYATHGDVDSCFSAFAHAAMTEIWADVDTKDIPEGLPTL